MSHVLGCALIVNLQVWEGGREGKGDISYPAAGALQLLRKPLLIYLFLKGRKTEGGWEEIWFDHISEAYVLQISIRASNKGWVCGPYQFLTG